MGGSSPTPLRRYVKGETLTRVTTLCLDLLKLNVGPIGVAINMIGLQCGVGQVVGPAACKAVALAWWFDSTLRNAIT